MPTAFVLELRIKIGIETVLVVKKFLIAKQWRIWPDRLQEERLPPSRMGANQIRNKPLELELFGRPGTAIGTDDFGFRFHHKGMHPLGVAAIEAIPEIIQRLRQRPVAIQIVNAEGNQLVLALLGQPLNDVNVLTREVLVNKQNPHDSQRRCSDSALSWNSPRSSWR